MADDLIQSSMAGTQQIPANFQADESTNLDDVSPLPYRPVFLGNYLGRSR